METKSPVEQEILEELKKITSELKKVTSAISEQTYIIDKKFRKENHDQRIKDLL